MLYELFTGEVLFAGKSNNETVFNQNTIAKYEYNHNTKQINHKNK